MAKVYNLKNERMRRKIKSSSVKEICDMWSEIDNRDKNAEEIKTEMTREMIRRTGGKRK